MSAPVAIFVAVLLLLGNAFFVAAEFALVSARRTQIEPRAEAGSRFARTTLRAMENISLVIGVNQLGITVCSLVLGAVGEPAVAHLLEPVLHAAHVPESFLHPIAFVVGLAIVVYLHVVMGEMIPKNLALAGPDRAALALGPPIWFIVKLLRPVIVVINAVAAGVLRLAGVKLMDEVSSTYTREEVAALVEESRGRVVSVSVDISTDSTVFSVKPSAPARRSYSSASSRPSPRDSSTSAATGFSRFPVEGADGELLGYLHIKDVLEPDESRRERPIDDKWIRPFATVAVEDTLHDTLETLQRRGAHMARVVDTAGVTLGLATLEDVIEELVGEIRDAAHLEEHV